jgi:hypothetical protein
MQSSRRKVAVTLLTVLAVYAAAPYVTLYRLAQSIRRGDAASLEALVDWDQVREGIKEDICDTVFDTGPASAGAKDADALPPFGFSFVRGIAGNVIDQNVTPSGLVTAASQFQAVSSSGARVAAPAANATSEPSITWAFFDTPTVFHVELLPPTEAGLGREPIRLEMELGVRGWKVTRARLPPSMLTQANPRT